MSAETMRRAAALMRERATAATPGPWVSVNALYPGTPAEEVADQEHIASWHPAVAVAVADLLDTAALGCEVMAPLDWDYPEGPMDCTGSLRPEFTKALTVARAYLGEDE